MESHSVYVILRLLGRHIDLVYLHRASSAYISISGCTDLVRMINAIPRGSVLYGHGRGRPPSS